MSRYIKTGQSLAVEKWLNEKRGKGVRKIDVLIIPTPRDRLLSDLVEGRGDIAAGNLTITPERLESVDFSNPIAKGVKEIFVPGHQQGSMLFNMLTQRYRKENK